MPKVDDPLFAKDAQRLKHVDDSKVYRCVIQVGARQKWRNFSGGRWKRQDDTAKPGKRGGQEVVYNHVPAIHETPPLTGRIVNGLISKHNQWVVRNKEQDRLGAVDRQLLVLNVIETNEVPEDGKLSAAGINLKLIESVVRSVVQEAIKSK